MVLEISLLAIKVGSVGIFKLLGPDTRVNLCA